MRAWIAVTGVLIAGGASAKPHIEVAAQPGMKLRYGVCADQGSAVIEVGAQRGAELAKTATFDEQVAIDGAAWRLRDSVEGDLSQDLAIDGRHRSGSPQLVAARADGQLWLAAIGMPRDALRGVVRRLRDPKPDADPRHHHRAADAQLHLPWPAAFESASLEGDRESYHARFQAYSLYGGMTGSPGVAIAGATLRYGKSMVPLDDHGGGPLRAVWHGETVIGDVVLAVDATGDRVSEASYLAFAKQIVRAAMRDPQATCRDRHGHWPASGYLNHPGDVFELVEARLELVTAAGARRELALHGDGTIRRDGRRLGALSVNGYVFAQSGGIRTIHGTLDRRGRYEPTQGGEVRAARDGTLTEVRTGRVLLAIAADGTVTGALVASARSARYTGPHAGRTGIALAMLLAGGP